MTCARVCWRIDDIASDQLQTCEDRGSRLRRCRIKTDVILFLESRKGKYDKFGLPIWFTAYGDLSKFYLFDLKIIWVIVVLSMFRQACSLQKRKKKGNEKKVIYFSFEELYLFLIRFRLLFRHGSGFFLKFLVSDFKFFYWFPDLLPTLDVEDRNQPSSQNLLLATPVFDTSMEIDWWNAWKKNELYAVRKNCFVNCLRVVHRC